MILIALYLTFLLIAPQLWIKPLLGVRVDLFLYPVWFVYVVVRGRLLQLVRLRAQDWFFLGFVVWNVLTLVPAGMPDRGTQIAINCAKWFVLYRLTAATCGDIRGVRWAGKLVALFALVLAVEGVQHMWSADGLGWAGQTFGWVDESAATLGLDKRTRWINIFDGPGVFCVVYTIALPFLIQYFGPPYGLLARALAVAPTALLLLATFYTGSRGGYITALVILGSFAAVRAGLSKKKLIALGVFGVLFVMVGPAYLTSTRDSSNSAQHRVDMWAEGIEMAQYHPVLGIGRGRFAEYTGTLIAHNSAVEIMGEAGFAGLFLWLGIVYTGMKSAIRAGREAEDEVDAACARALALCIAGYLVSSMFVTLEYETFYFLLGLTAASDQGLDEPATFHGRDALVMLGIIAGFFVFLKLFVMAY